MVYILIITLLFLAVMTLTAMFQVSSKSPLFWIIVPLLIFNIGFSWIVIKELKGWPVHTMPPNEAIFYSASIEKPYIFILAKPEQSHEPRLYAIPFSEQAAKDAHKASESAKKGQKLVIKQDLDQIQFHKFDHTKKYKKGLH